MQLQRSEAWQAAQQGAIGSMLIDPGCVPEVLGATDANDFEDDLRLLWLTIRGLYQAGEEIDPVKVLNVIEGDGRPGLRPLIVELMRTTPTSANALEYAAICRERSRLDALQRLGYKLAAALDLDEARNLLSQGEELLMETRDRKGVTWGEMIDRFMTAKDEEKEFIDWGLAPLNNALHVDKGKFILLGGRPSSGKSALMFQLAQHLSQSRKVAIFSCETDEEEATARMVSHTSGVAFRRVVRGEMTDRDWGLATQSFARTYDRTLETVPAAGYTVEDVVQYTRARQFEVIFVDYLQILRSSNPREIREQQVAHISRTLQQLAKRNGVVVVGLCQLSRPEKGARLEPRMSDLRESGQLEQDADAILMLYTVPKAEDYEDLEHDARRLAIVKNKTGWLGDITLTFQGDKQRFISGKEAGREEPPSADNPFVQSSFSDLAQADGDNPF